LYVYYGLFTRFVALMLIYRTLL